MTASEKHLAEDLSVSLLESIDRISARVETYMTQNHAHDGLIVLPAANQEFGKAIRIIMLDELESLVRLAVEGRRKRARPQEPPRG